MYENLGLPETIDNYIIKGINKGKRKKTKKRIKQSAGLMICLVLTIFISGIRISPVLASNVAKIPGLKYLVEIVRFDKGLTSAIDNDYIQSVDKSSEKLSIVFTVKDIIADNSGIIVFYSIENKGNYKWPHISEPKLLNSNGKELEMSSSYGFGPYESSTYEGKIDYHFVNRDQANFEIPDRVILTTKIAVNNVPYSDRAPTRIEDSPVVKDDSAETVLEENWTVDFSIDKSKFSELEKVYTINKLIEVEGQKILFEDIKIYPTKSILTVNFDKTNSKRIFAFENLKLVDENGQEWGRINNGITGSYPGENSQTLNFQSNFFNKPKVLYLVGDTFRALNKKDCYFTVDVEKKQISYSPNNLLSISKFSLADKKLYFEAEILKDIKDINNNFDISHEVVDDNGDKLEIISSGMGNNDKKSFMNYTIELNENFKRPITFKIQDYPSKIKGKFKVEIPLDN